MSKPTAAIIRRRFLQGAFFVALIFLATYVIPAAVGQRDDANGQASAAGQEFMLRSPMAGEPDVARPRIIDTTSGAKIYQPDVMGYGLYQDYHTAEKKLVSQSLNLGAELQHSKTGTSQAVAGYPVFPGFPVIIPSIGYNVALEGAIFCNMDNDPDLEIVVDVGQTIQAVKTDGTSVPGWPQTISELPSGAPAFGDITGDGEGEIVAGSYIGSTGGKLYAFHKNGTLVSGFPVNTGYIEVLFLQMWMAMVHWRS